MDEDHPLDNVIAELGWMHAQFTERHDEGDFDDWAQRLLAVIETLENLREAQR